MADIYDRFRDGRDYYDIMGIQPPTASAGTPTAQTVAIQQGGGIPTTQRVLNVGRNDYNMQGTLDAEQRYGIPRVMVQTDPYARIAYSYGPSGPIPLIGATSVYPHVVSSGMYDYAAPYRRTIVPVGASLADIMAHIERMGKMMRRGGGTGGSGGGNGTSKTTPAGPKTDDESKVKRPDSRGLKLSPDDDAAERQDLLVPRTEQTISAPAGSEAEAETMKYPWEWYPGGGFADTPEGGMGVGDMIRGATDWVMGKLRSMPRNVKPGRAPEGLYPVAPEATQPMLAPDAVPVAPEVQPYLVPQQTLSGVMGLPLRSRGPSILIG